MRVLVIADQNPLVRNLKQCFAEEGLALELARDRFAGNYKAHSGSFDAIVLDQALSGEDGLALLRDWRKKGLNTAVLVLGKNNNPDQTVRTLDLGADDCLPRPFQLQELTARLRALLRRGRGQSSPLLRSHDLEIDTATRTVRRSDRVIHLTRREYALLEFLALHRGQVVTRSMIWEHLYDEHDANTSNVVDVYIRYLRNKIDKDFTPPLILTRWGRGYLLRADTEPQQEDEPVEAELPSTRRSRRKKSG